eukprot:5392518-Prymnesium_polylepis.1
MADLRGAGGRLRPSCVGPFDLGKTRTYRASWIVRVRNKIPIEVHPIFSEAEGAEASRAAAGL